MKRYAVPVFVIGGFLESGKTTFINEAILSDPEVKKSKTLIILCEEGETEIEKDKNVFVHTVEEKENLTQDLFIKLCKEYSPDRVLIEYNCMWGMEALCDVALPKNWRYAQQMALVDASDFESYYANMRNIFFELFQSSDAVLFNRCDRDKTSFASLRTKVKTVNPDAEIMYTDNEGMIDITFEDELPYSLNDDLIELDDESYPIWYIDVMDNPTRYVGKSVEFDAVVARPKNFPNDRFVPGKHVMTCCSEDMAFLGYVCKWDGAKTLSDYDKIHLRANIDYRYCNEYGEKGPVLTAEAVDIIEKK